jgi:superfamily II DNA or RNA helicase/HKD family nuclease
MGRLLADGLYEHVVTGALARELSKLEQGRNHDIGDLDAADSHLVLARHLASEVERVLATVVRAERPKAQVEIVNRLLAELRSLVPRGAELSGDASESVQDAQVEPPGRELRAIFRAVRPERPATPLASSTLLTRNRAEPSLGGELAREIASSDRIDVLVAFVTVGGVRVLREALESFVQRGSGSRLRVLTTVFTGTTEVNAVESLALLPGATVKISYDVRRTRLHAKAWLFHRETGLHTAYVGSANLTSTALGSGQEWMVKVCAADLPHVIEKFRGTFEGLWNDAEFEPYDPGAESSRARLREALQGEKGRDEGPRVFFSLRPLPFQEEILDRLAAERLVHGRRRNLVVAATGTGKTVVAAFDYVRQIPPSGIPPRLLFLAHRRELLDQARDTFRHALHDGAFGELLVGSEEPARFDHVFATIQSAVSRKLLERLGPEHFRYVVVDECHHAPAESYRALIPKLLPDILLGLTATPERPDGKSLLPDFDGHVAAELRIWHALDRQLLVPFEYYGISDSTDLTRVRWSRTGYDAAGLAGVYTGNEARVDLVVRQLERRVADVRQIRALAFCVSIEHAEFMAKALTARGLPALAVHGNMTEADRADAPRRLREQSVNVLCTCDLYNEGVDLPFVDTLLLLRPTASATLFLQQLGRGLRLSPGKPTCLVLDFIGRHRAEFRFDATLSALTGIPRARLTRAVEEGFPLLPSGCAFQLDAVARQQVLASLKTHLGRRSRIVEEVKELAAESEKRLSLGRYLEATGRDLEEIYQAGGWTKVRRDAGLVPGEDDDADDLSRRLGWLLHVDEPTRIRLWAQAVEGRSSSFSETDRTRLSMLGFQLQHRGVLQTAEETLAYVGARQGIREEFLELSELLADRVSLPEDLYPVPEWPLALHRHYSRREIAAGVSYVTPGDKGGVPQGGILKLPGKREILLVTLDKSSKSFSPTTRYRDYAISPTLFHWETQSVASVTRESGRRYIESPGNGWSFYLFVRADQDAPYAFAGPVTYVSHEGDRPIAVTWELRAQLPAGLYGRFATLAQG